MKEMNLREKIGQMIMTGFPSSSITPELVNLIEEYKVANIILFSYNVSTIEQISGHCRELHRRIEEATGHPAFIAVDQEGGVVTRLPIEACNVPGAMLIGATGKEEYAYQAGCITGAELKAIGVNMDLAPVLDINSNPDNPVIGTRSYSSEALIVERFGCNMMKGLQAAGVMPTVKHFPGHGDTSVDSHLGLPTVEKDLDELMSMELIPFQSAIDKGVPCVMTSHILFPKLEKEHVPATMSKAILTDLLREKLGFQGIIITDCLEMGAIVNHYGTAHAAVEAVKAGAQLLCISHTPALVKESIQRIEEAVLSGEIPIELIDEAVATILKFKMDYRIDSTEEANTVDRNVFKKMIEKIILEGVTKVSKEELPGVDQDTVILGCYAYRSTLVSSPLNKGLHFAEYLSERLQCSFLDVPLNPTEEEMEHILEQIGQFPKVIYGLYNGHLNRGQLTLAKKIAESNKAFTAITLRNPYDLAFLGDGIHKLAAYEYNTQVFEALIRILNREVPAIGTLPVKLKG
jgi:beta-N-acetylhexosaminidase